MVDDSQAAMAKLLGRDTIRRRSTQFRERALAESLKPASPAGIFSKMPGLAGTRNSVFCRFRRCRGAGFQTVVWGPKLEAPSNDRISWQRSWGSQRDDEIS
jgi:hypothetical protein